MPLHIIHEDITKMRVDAIVNAANNALQQGGGVCGAIFEAAGERALTEACDKIGGCATGSAVITPGFQLPAKYIIHTPGPVWAGGAAGEAEKLTDCYTNALALAQENGCSSIAFPLIASGIYEYPKEQAISVAVSAIGAYLLTHADVDAYLVLYGRDAHACGNRSFPGLERYIEAQFLVQSDGETEDITECRIDNPDECLPCEMRMDIDADNAMICDMADSPIPTDADASSCVAQAAEQASQLKTPTESASIFASACERPGLHLPKPAEWLRRLMARKKKPVTKPEAFVAKSQEPAARPEQSAAKPEASAAKPVVPAAKPEASAAKPVVPAAKPEASALRPVVPAAKPEAFVAKSQESAAKPAVPNDRRRFEMFLEAESAQAAQCIEASIAHDEAHRYTFPEPFAMEECSDYDAAEVCFTEPVTDNRRLSDVVRQLDESFSERVLRCIDEKGWTDVEVYKRANLDRKLFSKIRSDPKYQPSKRTAIALAIALRLNLDETRDLLQKAGYALSRSTLSDVIVTYFIEAGEYDIFKINLALYEFGEALLSA